MTLLRQFDDLIYIVDSLLPLFLQNLLMHQTSKQLGLIRWIQIATHVIGGVCTLSFIFPFLTRAQKDQKIQAWSRKLLNIFGIHLSIHGQYPSDLPYLVASNHISWLDIHVINAFKPIRFVAKSEVEGWPIFGWMAKQLGTVFIRRDSSRHARQVVGQMAKVLQTESICIFPEGTSTNGESVLLFKSNLFEAAIASQTPVLPLAIQYTNKATGRRSEAPAFIGDMGLLESMGNVLNEPNLEATLTFLPVIQPVLDSSTDRKALANRAQSHITEALRLHL